jgi:hypothetical protein
MMTVCILSKRTTSGGQHAVPTEVGVIAAVVNEKGDTIRNQFWSLLGQSRSAGVLGNIVLGRA